MCALHELLVACHHFHTLHRKRQEGQNVICKVPFQFYNVKKSTVLNV